MTMKYRTVVAAAMAAAVAAILLPCALACGQVNPVRPYVDPNQLNVPWPKHSHLRQPWRAFLTTKSAADFLDGIGVAYNVHDNDELAMRLIAETGFRALRLEIGWGSVNWDETGLSGQKHIAAVLAACKKYGIRPTLLLNAHQGVPCPVRFFNKKLAEDAPKGARTVRLADTKDIVVGRSGINQLSDYWAAEAIVTKIDEATGLCELSKPLPKDLPKDKPLAMATLKYLPLYPAGTKEFDDSAAGWVRYALLACKAAADAGIEDFDVEIWNELSFGTRFLQINNYYDPGIAPAPGQKKAADFLNAGGNCWELARRTVEAVKAAHPKARCIWGFSNTTFFHCAVKNLPPRMDGQSYHPYGTGTRSLPDRETHKDHPDFCVDGFIPKIDIRMSEGWAHTFTQTESIMRLLNPEARKATPLGTTRFYHYMTEHGVVPAECGVTDEPGEWRLKTKCLLRSMCLWLNKGVDTMDYFCAWEATSAGMGLLPPGLPKLPADAKFDDVATEPMKALRNLTKAMAGARPLAKSTDLKVEVASLGADRKIFDGDAAHPPLWYRDVFAFLPFQVDEGKFVVAVYVMTYDAAVAMPPQEYRLTISNLPAGAKFTLYDTLLDQDQAVEVTGGDAGVYTVKVSVVDYPRLLKITR